MKFEEIGISVICNTICFFKKLFVFYVALFSFLWSKDNNGYN